MIAPLYPSHASQILGSDGANNTLNDLRRSGSSASTHSLPTNLPYRGSNTQPQNQPTSSPQVLRKPAPPPVPNKKPSLLLKSPSRGTSPVPPPQQYRDDPPPAKRSMAPPPNLARKPIENLIDGEDKPPLPPRTGTNGSSRSGGGRNLMDDDPEDVHNNLRDWEVLRPVR
ncbi:hypothetical protein P3342_001969 [Pyrenophora teres f. teres]|nr:hypothetical protein P3342_001969 [Pyrenophora teres f. teres]